MSESSKPKLSHMAGGIVLLVVNLIAGWMSGLRTGQGNGDAAIYMIVSAVLLPMAIIAITLIWRSQRNPRSIAKTFMLASVVVAISNYGNLFA